MTVFDAEFQYKELTVTLYQMSAAKVREAWLLHQDAIESDEALRLSFFIVFTRMSELQNYPRLVELMHATAGELPSYKKVLRMSRLYRVLRKTPLGPLFARKYLERYSVTSEIKLFAGYYRATWTDHQEALRYSFPLLLIADSQKGASAARYKWTHGFIACLNGNFDEGVSLVKEGLSDIGNVPDETIRRLWENEGVDLLANCLFHSGDLKGAQKAHAEADAVFGSPVAFPFAWIFNHTMKLRAALAGNDSASFDQSVNVLKSILRDKYDSRFALRVHSHKAVFFALSGHFDEAFYEISVADSFSKKTSSPLEHFYHLTQKSRVMLVLGLIHDALKSASDAEEGLARTAKDGLHRVETLEQILLIQMVRLLRLPMSVAERRRTVRDARTRLNEFAMATAGSSILRARAKLYSRLSRLARHQNENEFLQTVNESKQSLGIRAHELLAALTPDNFRAVSEERIRSSIVRTSQNLERLGALSEFMEQLGQVQSGHAESLVQAVASGMRTILRISDAGAAERNKIEWLETAEVMSQSNGISVLSFESQSYVTLDFVLSGVHFVAWARLGQLDPGLYLDITRALSLMRQLALKHWQDSVDRDLRSRQEQAEALSQQARQVAHDIRSPLSSLKMVLANADGLSGERHEIAMKSIERVDLIAKQLLKSAREEARRQKTSTSGCLVEVNEMIGDAVAEKSTELHDFAQFIDVEKSNSVSSNRVFVDPIEFRRVLSNILNNAYEAVPKDSGKITIRVNQDIGTTYIRIADNGNGIPEDVLSSIGKKPLTFGKSEGNGLGLYHAANFARSHHGRLRVASRLGQGTEVLITLPQQGSAKVVNDVSAF